LSKNTDKPRDRKSPSLSERIGRERAEVSRVVEVMRVGLRGLYRSQLPRMAAALAYRTIFAFVPVFVIAMVVFGAVVSDDEIEWGVSQILDYTKLNEITVEPAMPDEGGDGLQAGSLEGTEPADASAEVPQDEKLDAWIRGLIMQIRQVPKTAIGLVSGLILIYAAIGMLVEVERAFNHIFRCVVGRSWWTRITLYWTMLTLGTILLGATFVVGQRFHAWVVDAEAVSTLGWIRVNVLGFAATAAISTLLLTIAYTRIPNTRVKLRPAFIGALVGAILWEAGKFGFTQYVSFSSSYARFYGSLALIPLFMLWIYVTWIIVLFGLQVSYALQTFSSFRGDNGRADDLPRIIEPEMVLAVAGVIARAFEHGKGSRLEAVADETGLPEAVCTQMMDRLEQRGYIHRLEGDEDEPVYAPSMPADRLEASALIDAVEGLASYDPPQSVVEAREARRQALEGKTLADVMTG
jgi:membrane protein